MVVLSGNWGEVLHMRDGYSAKEKTSNRIFLFYYLFVLLCLCALSVLLLWCRGLVLY
jgi:hypothetical protein